MLISGVFLLLDAARPPVLRLAVRGVCMLAIGALLYVAGLAAALHFGGVSLHPGGSNSLTNLTQPLGDLWGLLTGAYRDVGTVLVTARGPYAAPVVQVATALLLALAGQWVTSPGLYLLSGLNLGLMVWNLLPAGPLDGGRALSLLLSWVVSPAAADAVLRITSLLTAAGMIGLGCYTLHRGGGFTLLTTGLWLLFQTPGGRKCRFVNDV